MTISVNDLKGFDFSDKYLNINESFSIKKDGKQVDFNIEGVKSESRFDEHRYILRFEYYDEFQLVKLSTSFKNPFKIFREVESNILKSESELDIKTMLIKDTLEEFNPDFDNWNELSKKLSSNTDILKLNPDYKSSKIPQNLSKEDLAKYLDNFSKYELEELFKDLSMFDFEIFYKNTWGEDYEYLIEKAFTYHVLGEKVFSRTIFEIINQKRDKFYMALILKNYGFDVDEHDLMVPVIYSIINSDTNRGYRDRKSLKLQRLMKQEKIDLIEDDSDKLDKIMELREKVYENYDSGYSYEKTDFNNLDDCLTNAKYVFVLKAISSTSKSQIVMRYKTPNENRDEDSVQTIALNNGHIKYGDSKDNLSEYTVGKLKNVLRKYNLKLQGNKSNLIERIKDNLSDEIINEEFPKKYFSLTEEGQKYLDKYYYLAEFSRIIPPNFSLDEFDVICKSNSDISPDEIITCLVNEKWLIWSPNLGVEPELFSETQRKRDLEKIFKSRDRDDNYYSNPGSIILV